MQTILSKRKTILAIVILLQVIVILFVGAHKQEYFIDEIYSYVLSNSYDADKLSNADNIWGRWIAGSDLNEFVSVQPGEGFSYGVVYKNNSTDCHPPLYYWLLHTVCSIFPNTFSKWFGIGLNIVFFVATEIFVYLISAELIRSDILKFLPAVLYGFSSFAVDTAVFIRMYMMLTFFSVVFIYLHVLIYKFGPSKGLFAAVWAVIFLGSMTQYYFLFLAFFGVLLYAIYLAAKKDYKSMLLYGLGALVAVALFIAAYPYAISQATGSATNNVGNEVAANLFNFSLWIKMARQLAGELAGGLCYNNIVAKAIAIVLIAAFIFLIIKHVLRPSGNISFIKLWLMLLFGLVFLTVTFVGGRYVYIRYIYYVMPLFYLLCTMPADSLCSGSRTAQNITALVCALFAVCNAGYGAARNKSSQLNLNYYEQDLLLNSYSSDELIVAVGVVDESNTAVPTWNLTKFSSFNRVYMDSAGEIENSSAVSDALSDDGTCVIYVATENEWINDGFESSEEAISQLTEGYEVEAVLITSDGSLGDYYMVTASVGS